MMYRVYTVLLFVALGACGEQVQEPAKASRSYNIDTARISVSGVSSGAYMAGQLHLAHSSVFGGVAMIAGGPHYCAMGDVHRALGPCLKGGELSQNLLLDYAHSAAASGDIDNLKNLEDDRAWIFHGSLDVVVHRDSSVVAAAMYEKLMPKGVVKFVDDVASVHGMPTKANGVACGTFAPPFLNACDYDAAGEILSALHSELRPPNTTVGSVRMVQQPGHQDAQMMPNAFIYVPASCEAGESCGVHVALHGCSQSAEFVDNAFASGAGFNEWAEANKMLVLYPQASASKIAPMNPYGCWDWWGYSGENYATRHASQITVIKAMLDQLAGREL